MAPVIISDDEFASAVVEAGLVQAEALEATRREVEEIRSGGRHVSLAHLLVKRKHIALDQRKKLEKKLRIAKEKLPERIGSYRLLKKLGEGGMGSVYLAEEEGGRRVALKTLSKALAKDTEGRARFRREATAASELQHPHVVCALSVGEADGLPFYAMEFCDGETLEDILDRDGKMPLALSLNVIAQVADGLAYAHARGIVHRDIKPGNIFLLRSGQAKILDLGLSKNYKTHQSFHTMEGTALGTPNYLSPEQAQAIAELDGRTDQYGLAATLYHMLTGIAPFDAPSATAIMMGHIGEQLADLRTACPQAPLGLVEIMTRMMAKDPDDRYPDLRSVLEDLDRVKSGQSPASEPLDPALSSLGRRKEAQQPAHVTSGQPEGHLPTSQPLSHGSGRPGKGLAGVPWPWLLGAIVVVLVVLLVVVWALSGE